MNKKMGQSVIEYLLVIAVVLTAIISGALTIKARVKQAMTDSATVVDDIIERGL
jgi:Flp pilus assembly pilin Flp